MKRFIEGEDRGQGVLLPELLDDYVTEDNPVRVVDVFVEELDLASLGFGPVHELAREVRCGSTVAVHWDCSTRAKTPSTSDWSQDMSKALQEQREKIVGDWFASWLASTSGELCTFKRRGTPKFEPDLVYEFKNEELGVEVTSAYYGGDHAAFLWKGVGGDADAPAGWSGVNPDASLADAVLTRVAQKSLKIYADNAVLLIDIPPGVTSAEELERRLAVSSLQLAPFSGIYVVGRFPITTTSAGGYRVLTLKSMIDRHKVLR